MEPNTPVVQINNIGPAYAKRLAKLEIREVKDLLFHFPTRYEDFSKIILIKNITLGENITICGHISDISQRSSWKNRRMKIIEATVEDDSGQIQVMWFNQPYIEDTLHVGTKVYLSGKATLQKIGLVLSSPMYEVKREGVAPVHTARLVPVYPETARVSSRWFRYIIKRLMPTAELIDDPLPTGIVKEKGFPGIQEALTKIHFPKNLEEAQEAKERFVFGELFFIQLAALKTKYDMSQERAPRIKTNVKRSKAFVDGLPWKLTDSQKKASWRILKDMELASPMNRLLEGDVGSGKTIVAALAALNVMDSGHQAVFMAPTEILAQQHFKNLSELFRDENINIALLTRTNKKNPHEAANLIVGTHSLIQNKVSFDNLGLVVIDEQHRFGVKQRATLVKKDRKIIPHLLSMTATPIPRTLALTIYGDLDISLLREMPAGRKEIITKIIPPGKREEAYTFIKSELDKERQAFVVFPLVEESEKLALRAATEESEKLANGPFKNYKLGLLHGKMKAPKKAEIMEKFQNKQIDMLVSTSVVEVGIDIPNATIMMIDGADRFGLAQLHQFRGRVGRSEHQSYCFLLTDSRGQEVRKRLSALQKTSSGFELAEYDLSFRGSGDLYGVRQSGMPDLAMASLPNVKLIEETREAAENLLEEDPELKNYEILKKKISDIQKSMHFE